MDASVKILVACSSAEARDSVTEILKGWGADVLFAGSVQEAQKVLSEQRTSLVFCESDLIDGTFRDLLTAIANCKAAVRLVALVQDDGAYRKAIQSGAFEAIPMPCQRSDVQWAVIRAMRR